MEDTIIHNAETCGGVHRGMQDALYVINGKWKMLILACLTQKPYRFRELTRELDISPRMLSKELLELEMNLLVTRTVIDSKPVGVEYSSTEYGKTLQPVFQALTSWGINHRKKIAEQ